MYISTLGAPAARLGTPGEIWALLRPVGRRGPPVVRAAGGGCALRPREADWARGTPSQDCSRRKIAVQFGCACFWSRPLTCSGLKIATKCGTTRFQSAHVRCAPPSTLHATSGAQELAAPRGAWDVARRVIKGRDLKLVHPTRATLCFPSRQLPRVAATEPRPPPPPLPSGQPVPSVHERSRVITQTPAPLPLAKARCGRARSPCPPAATAAPHLPPAGTWPPA